MNKTVAILASVIALLFIVIAFLLGRASSNEEIATSPQAESAEISTDGSAERSSAPLLGASSASDLADEASLAPEPPSAVNAIWKDGQGISGSCYAKLGENVIMNGTCSGLGHGNSLFVTAEADGCSLDISLKGATAAGTLFSYRNPCGELDTTGVSVGPFVKQASCWVAPNARFCLRPDD